MTGGNSVSPATTSEKKSRQQQGIVTQSRSTYEDLASAIRRHFEGQETEKPAPHTFGEYFHQFSREHRRFLHIPIPSKKLGDTWRDRIVRFAVFAGITQFISNLHQYWISDFSKLIFGVGIVAVGGFPVLGALCGVAFMMAGYTWWARRREQKLYRHFEMVSENRARLWDHIDTLNGVDENFIHATLKELFNENDISNEETEVVEEGRLAPIKAFFNRQIERVTESRLVVRITQRATIIYPLVMAISAAFATIYFVNTMLPLFFGLFHAAFPLVGLPLLLVGVGLSLFTAARVFFSERYSLKQTTLLNQFAAQSEHEIPLMKKALFAMYKKRIADLADLNQVNINEHEANAIIKNVKDALKNYQNDQSRKYQRSKLRLGLNFTVGTTVVLLNGLMNAASIFYGVPWLLGLMGVNVAMPVALTLAILVGVCMSIYKTYDFIVKYQTEQKTEKEIVEYESILQFENNFELKFVEGKGIDFYAELQKDSGHRVERESVCLSEFRFDEAENNTLANLNSTNEPTSSHGVINEELDAKLKTISHTPGLVTIKQERAANAEESANPEDPANTEEPAATHQLPRRNIHSFWIKYPVINITEGLVSSNETNETDAAQNYGV